MSLEESINLLVAEINQLSSLIKLNNELLVKRDKEPTVTTKRLLNETEAAKYIGMSRSYLNADRSNGHRVKRTKGPNPIKLGKKVLYEIDELNAWLTSNKIIR